MTHHHASQTFLSASATVLLIFFHFGGSLSQKHNATTHIYMRRMRKSGSTTLQFFLQDAIKFRMDFLAGVNRTTDNNTVVKLKRDLWLRPRRKTHQEGVLRCRIKYASLNSACIIPQFGRVGTLLVTHFREPIHRQVSEFWYRGPGFWTGVSDAKTWMDWMEARGAKW